MIKRNSISFLFALFPLIPISSRFAYSCIIVFCYIVFFLFGIVFQKIQKRINNTSSSLIIELVGLAFTATLLQMMVAFVSPVLAISLGFSIFLTSFSFLLLLSIDRLHTTKTSLAQLGKFLVFFIIFSAIRELIGGGTLSFPYQTGIYSIQILPYFSQYGLSMWQTAGGALILLGICAYLFKFFQRRIITLRRNT